MLTPLEQHLALLLEKRQAQGRLRTLKSSPPDSVDFSSNDFLSLSSNGDFRNDYLSLVNHHLSAVGSTGSRLLDGNSPAAERLENAIAGFHGAEAALLTNSGFDANVSIFGFIPQPGDTIIYDQLIHASVHDGMKQSRCRDRLPFRHNDLEHIASYLEGLASKAPQSSIFVAVESVYSMDGDVAPLKEIVSLIEKFYPDGGAYLIVDEAHSTGCYGPNGSGRVCELGLEKKVPIRLHTFGKALASSGAAILCSDIIRSYIINYARPMIYTTFMSYPSLLAIQNAYDWLQSGKTDALAINLSFLIKYLYEDLQTLRYLATTASASIGETIVVIPPKCPMSPIFALFTPRPRSLATFCQAAGFLVRPIVSPTVEIGTERVRVCLHAGNTVEQIRGLVLCIKMWIQNEVKANDARLTENENLHRSNSLEALSEGHKPLVAKI